MFILHIFLSLLSYFNLLSKLDNKSVFLLSLLMHFQSNFFINNYNTVNS